MIGLRVLHVLSPLAAGVAMPAAALADWQRAAGHSVAIAVPAEQLAAVSEWFGTATALPLPGGLRAWWSGRRAAPARALAAWAPDIIHVHDLDQLEPALTLARQLSVAVMVGVLRNELPVRCRALSDPRVAWVLVQTESQRAHFLGEVGLARDQVAILPSGVPVPPTPPALRGDDALDVGCAPFADLDALGTVLQALAELARDGVAVRAQVLAGADELKRIRRLCARHELPVQIHAVGAHADFISASDAFVDVSAGDLPAWPLLCAMAAARPVIAAAAGAKPELVRDNDSALLVAPTASEALLSALRQLRASAVRVRLGAAGRALVQERFDVAITAAATLELYHQVLGSGVDGVSANERAETSNAYRRISETRLH